MFWLVVGILLGLLVLGVAGTVTVSITKAVGGFINGSQSSVYSDETGVLANPTVPVGQPGVLTTHTTNTTGSLTMTNALHGITTGQRIDVYWAGGQCYGAVAGTVSGLVVPIASVSGGSNLPASSTPVTIGICTSAPFNVVGANLAALVLITGVNGYFVIANGGDLVAYYLTAGTMATWGTGDVGVNPILSGTPTKVFMSHTNTTVPATSMMAAAVSH